MGLVDSPQARVCVVVGIHAKAKRFFFPLGFSSPVIAVMTEAVHLFR